MLDVTDGFRTILGIRFFAGNVSEAVEVGLHGGLVVAPAGPALVDLERDVDYREALVNADVAITDSGLMVLLWWFLQGERLKRVSGLAYLSCLLTQPEAREPGKILWIMPTVQAKNRNLEWLRRQGLPCSDEYLYVAPMYDQAVLNDPVLLNVAGRLRPKHIIIGLGGGTQERLGLFLKRRLDAPVSIHCIGAAIGFLTGDQVAIPRWADALFVGWLFRCVSDPKRFAGRYWKARRLLRIMWKYRGRLPDIEK